MPRFGRKKIVVGVSIFVVLTLAGVGVALFLPQRGERHDEARVPATSRSAPPDIVKYRGEFMSGVEALQRDDADDAIKHFESFSYGDRAVEEYRLYYLANAFQLKGSGGAARQTLAKLWRRKPRMIYRTDAAFNAGDLYARGAHWREAAAIYAAAAAGEPNDLIRGNAHQQSLETSFFSGDLAGVVLAAEQIVIEAPKSQAAPEALAALRAIHGAGAEGTVPLTLPQRVTRAESLLEQGAPQDALGELAPLDPAAFPSPFHERIRLTRGIALHKLRRFEDSEKALEPLYGGYFKYSIPALYHSSKNNQILAGSINPFKYRTITIKQKAGTVKVRKGKRLVTRPRYKNVKKTEKLVILHLKQKQESYEARSVERMKDILLLPAPQPMRREVLNTLLARAMAKNQDAYIRELVEELLKIDPYDEPALQYLWDKGWSRYRAGDLDGAREQFAFISSKFKTPNVRRQTRYWYARILERSGEKTEAARIYQELVNVPYRDIYAVFAERRGAKPPSQADETSFHEKPDAWDQIAQKNLPDELKLAYELNAIGFSRDASNEIKRNINDGNRRYAEAILGDMYYADGAVFLGSRSLRRAFPQLATVEQDSVPPHFLKLYYPLRHIQTVEKEAAKWKVDPNLVLGLILQESAFNPQAKSSVGALGLMQIMPPTGKELARKMGKSFSPAKLTTPDYNIQLGVRYVRELIDRMNGNVEMAIASYNGGMGNVWKWRRANPGQPMDEFVESIPFSETRGYVKRVSFYRSVYEKIR